jgi:hypothetical protein
MASAPPGGCRHLKRIISQSVAATAKATATTGCTGKAAASKAETAAARHPPSTDQGCASGLCGRANRMMVEAPMGGRNRKMHHDAGQQQAQQSSHERVPPRTRRQRRRIGDQIV